MKSINRPAILGGAPIFAYPLQFNEPTLPDYADISSDIASIVESGQLTNGPRVAALEERAAELCGRPVVAVSSCTSGLILAYRLLNLSGSVILPSFTFFATSHALFWNNLRPRFVDIAADTWTIDPQAVEEAITPEVSAIVAVDVFGNPAAKDALAAIAARHGLTLITDAAHSLGARYGGRPVGSFGDAEVFSLSPTKLVAAGEGGLAAVRDPEIAGQMRTARDYGNPGDYDCRTIGLNARMTEINAAMALAGLEELPRNVQKRNDLAGHYKKCLERVDGLEWQAITDGASTTYKDIAVKIDSAAFGVSRDSIRRALAAEGVPTRTYFDPPAHLQQAYAGRVEQCGDLARTNELCSTILCLPVFSHMDSEQVEGVCCALERIQEHAASVDKAFRGEV